MFINHMQKDQVMDTCLRTRIPKFFKLFLLPISRILS